MTCAGSRFYGIGYAPTAAKIKLTSEGLYEQEYYATLRYHGTLAESTVEAKGPARSERDTFSFGHC